MEREYKLLKAIEQPYSLLRSGKGEVCNYDACDGTQYSLGVCHKHYQAAYRLRTKHRKIREQ